MRKKLRLVDGGPGFELVEDGKVLHRVTCSPAPTYEQACVSIMRTAHKIEMEGVKAKARFELAQNKYDTFSHQLRIARVFRPTVYSTRSNIEFKRWQVQKLEREVCEALDNLWAAQEAYRAWEKLYGEA